jgi:predicted PurR-regulated permease PerM
MTDPTPAQQRLRLTWVILLTIVISLLFFTLIRPFIVTVLMAAIFSGMSHPLYARIRDSRMLKRLRQPRATAALITLLGVLVLIVVPLAGLMGIVAEQAVSVSGRVRPWVEQQLSQPSQLDALMQRFPILERLEPYSDRITAKLGDFAAHIGQFLVANLANVTRGAAAFFFHLFIMLYAMFFFLTDGKRMLDAFLRILPLDDADEQAMVGKFVSVSRATIKGTLVIGVVQGVLAGAALWAAGVGNAVFWGTVMAVLSIIPGVGTALVWVPAVVYLFAIGKVVPAIAVTVWCALVVGTADNFLRPLLVGRDTKMPDILILLSTLGGLLMFGALGLVLGPVIAALFLTIWDIFDSTMRAAVGGEPPPVEPA